MSHSCKYSLLVCKHFDQLLIVSGMRRRCREILYSFFEEKLPKLSEEKPSPVVAAADDDDDDVVITKMKELTMMRGIVINPSPL